MKTYLTTIFLLISILCFSQTTPHKQYYGNGQLEQEGNLVDNQRSGIWKIYYENGQLKSEEVWVMYGENFINTVQVCWDENDNEID